MARQAKAKRGHWPKGVARNEDSGDWPGTLAAVTKFIKRNWCRGTISWSAMAMEIGVDDSTVVKWRKGGMPSVESQHAMAKWLKNRIAEQH